jgi:hypothetical protein
MGEDGDVCIVSFTFGQTYRKRECERRLLTMGLSKREAQALAKKIKNHSKEYGIPLKKKKKNK